MKCEGNGQTERHSWKNIERFVKLFLDGGHLRAFREKFYAKKGRTNIEGFVKEKLARFGKTLNEM